MIWRLVRDGIWRSRWLYVSGLALLVPVWSMYVVFGARFASVPITVISLMAAAGLGPLFAWATMTVRALRHLPVTVRDIRIAAWILATLVPGGFLCASKILAVLIVATAGGTSAIPIEAIALAFVLDVIWTGCVLHVWLRSDAWLSGARIGDWARPVASLSVFTVVVGGFGAPLLLRNVVPGTLEELTPAVVAAMCAGAIVSVAMLFWTPTAGLFAGDRPRRPTAPRKAEAPKRIDRLTGLWRIAVPYVLLMMALSVGVWLAGAIYGLSTGRGVLAFVPPDGSIVESGGEVSPLVLIPAMMCVFLGPWTSWARQLKAVPLTVRQITALLVFTPFASAMLVLGMFWGVCAAAYGIAPVLRLDLVLGLAGLAALAHAWELRFQGNMGAVLLFGAVLSGFRKVLEAGLSDSTQIVFGAAGALAALMAAGINHSTLTRSTSSATAYQRPRAPFGQA